MTNDERAKAYELALEAARKELGVDRKEWEVVQRVLHNIFPELRESEDERIRRKMIEHFKSKTKETWCNMPIKDIIAYLEKQKEQKPDVDESTKRLNENWMKRYFDEQQEQKPDIEICPHSVKSKSYSETGYPIENCDYGLEIALNILEETLGNVQGFQTDDGIREHQTAIKAVKDAMKEQKPVEWSEEDEKMRDRIIDILNRTFSVYSALGTSSTRPSCPTYKDEIAWLKSLPERFNPQPKQEWSEEDEAILDSLIRLYSKEYVGEIWPWANGAFTYGDVVNFLKSLRPPKDCSGCAKHLEGYISGRGDAENKLLDQFGILITPEGELHMKPRWKPSKEQMEALMLAIEGKCPPTSYMSRRLEDLYDGLANTYRIDEKP